MTGNPWAGWVAEHGTQRHQLGRKQGWRGFVDAAPRPRFEVLSRKARAALPDSVKEDYDEARMVWNANLPIVRTHQMSYAFDLIDEVMASSRRDSDRLRGSVVVDAEPGLGKSTIAIRYGREYERRIMARLGPTTGDGHQRLPVAFVSLSAGVTLKGLNQHLLGFYGHPAARRSSTSDLGGLAVDCVQSCETGLIIIDDLHFVDFKHRHGIDVSNHLKWLANEMPVTFIYTGVRLSQKRFFDEGLLGEDAAYAQTSRRATKCPVTAFRIDSDAAFAAWVDLLHTLESNLILADAEPGMLTAHARELHVRTQGHIGSLMNLIDRAAYRAIRTGTESISADLIASTIIDNAAQSLAARR